MQLSPLMPGREAGGRERERRLEGLFPRLAKRRDEIPRLSGIPVEPREKRREGGCIGGKSCGVALGEKPPDMYPAPTYHGDSRLPDLLHPPLGLGRRVGCAGGGAGTGAWRGIMWTGPDAPAASTILVVEGWIERERQNRGPLGTWSHCFNGRI